MTDQEKKIDINSTLSMLFKADRTKILDTLLGFALMVGSKGEGRNPSIDEWWSALQMVEAACDMAPTFSTCTPEQIVTAMELVKHLEKN